MAKAPLAKDPEAKRKERRTVVASGPVPVPMPISPAPKAPAAGKEDPAADPDAEAKAKAEARAKLKKTQMIMGAPPLPPTVTGKTQVPSGPVPKAKAPKTPKAPPKPPTAKPPAVSEQKPLPSHERTVVGPAPAPPVPVKPTHSDEVMASMMEGGLFSEDFEEEMSTQIHAPSRPIVVDPAESDIGTDETLLPPSKPKPKPAGKPSTEPDLQDRFPADTPVKAPPRPSGPAPRATSGMRDTMPAAELRNGPTNPQAIGIADTHIDIEGEPARQDTGRRPTSVKAARGRESRASTAMHGTEGLAAPAADAPKIRLVPGKVIPGTRWEIRRWLGEGGMGVVYEVAHADIERRSALKILRFDLSKQPQMAQVFRDEARAASRLGSPHIVEVYDFGELGDGRLYFAMELLEGQDLVPADEQTTMEPSRLIAILRQVCKGLAKAHEAGVVHRDVKPENVILCETEDRADAVKIVDFGISAMLAAGEARAGIAGTPHYMAPEQILGEAFDGRLDIYALGCTAYELMVGMPPFDAEEVEDVLKQQVNAPPKRPSEVRPDVQFPPELEAVIMRCLAKKPAERYADMADLEAALCEAQIAAGITTAWDDLAVPVLADEERYQRIVAGMPSPHAVAPAKRSWLWPIVAGASTLAAASLAAYLAFGRQPTDEDVDEVERLTIEARDAASKAAWVVPPPHVEGDATALRKIVELESVEGLAESMADERGVELRHEFATTLIGHGDELWGRDAKDIAMQYYAWSLVFESNDHASERANIDPMTLAEIRRNAIAGNFNETAKLFAAMALMEVVEDPDEKLAMTEAFNKMSESATMAPTTRAQLSERAASVGIDRPKRGSGAKGNSPGRNGGSSSGGSAGSAGGDGAPAPGPEDDGADDAILIEDDGGEVEDPAAAASRKKRRRQVDMGLDGRRAKSDPARSKELTQQADAQRKKGHRGEAKSLYGQAIAANPKNGAAHLGLAQVHFDQASYDKARKSALAAVKYAPRNGRAHKVLGDAYYKAFRFKDAEGAYEEAQRLGVNVGKRLSDVRSKLGK